MQLPEKYQIIFFCRNPANKTETGSVPHSDCEKTSDRAKDDLSESGRRIRARFRALP